MTKRQRIFLGLGLAAALVPAVAIAWPGKFDANQDGVIDESERAAMKQARKERHAQMLAQYDANKDGTLDDTERAKLQHDFAAKRFAELDTNKDNMISFDEFLAGAPQHMGRHRGGPR